MIPSKSSMKATAVLLVHLSLASYALAQGPLAPPGALNPHQPRLTAAQAAVGQKSNSLAVTGENQ